MGRPATAKKDRLIDAAMLRYHHHGVAGSSLATVARAADVAAGNVYYYFQSKDLLTEAVIDRWCDRVVASLALHDTLPMPLDRVRAFVTTADNRRQAYTDHGCPLAALGVDLRSAPGTVGAQSGRPLALIRAWLADQFAQLDRASASARADFCLASLQGSFALAHATNDPAIVAHSTRQLLDWIDTL